MFYRYLAAQVGRAFATALGLFVGVVSLAQLMKLAEGAGALALGANEWFWLWLYGLLPIAGLLVPITWLYACLLAVGRLQQDGEILALMQLGLRPRVLYGVPVVGGLLLAAVSSFLLVWGEPWGMGRLSVLLGDAAQRAVVQGLAPGEFRALGPHTTLYAVARRKDTLEGLLLADSRRPTMPVLLQAARARVGHGNRVGELFFWLEDGAYAAAGTPEGPLVYFARARYRLDVRGLLPRVRRNFTDEQALDFASLWRRAYGPGSGDAAMALARITLQRKFSLPLAAPIFGALAVALCVRRGPAARNSSAPGRLARGQPLARSLLVSCGVVVAYYYLGRNLELLARNGKLLSWLAVWLPNGCGLLALLLFGLRPPLRGRPFGRRP